MQFLQGTSDKLSFYFCYRCAEFHPEARPDLENEILPQLHNLVGTVENGLSAPSEEPPEHLVCPITQVC